MAIRNHDVVVGETETGFVAASTQSPYFCFEGASEEEVLAKVKRALDFYHASSKTVSAKPSSPFTLNHMIPRKRINSKELVAA